MPKTPSLAATPITRAVARIDLLASLCREIGRIITRWAYLENAIQHTLRTLLGLSEEEGRLALQKARPNEQLDVIADVAHPYRLKVDTPAFRRMKAKIEKTTDQKSDGIRHLVTRCRPPSGGGHPDHRYLGG